MRVSTLFQISPPYVFGLPDGEKIVLPPGIPATRDLDSRTGLATSRGTVSQYRSSEEAIKLKLQLGAGEISIDDDYASISLDTDSIQNGYFAAQELMARFLRHVMAANVGYFSAKPLQVQTEDGAAYRAPMTETLFEAAAYALDDLRAAMATAASLAGLEDHLANRSLEYFEHARYLSFVLPRHEDNHATFLRSTAYLYFWKSLTTILGDPSTERDHQSRFRTLGFLPGFWKSRVKPLKTVRDTADVAHHSLDITKAKIVSENLLAIDALCREVICTYCRALQSPASGVD